VVADFEPSHRSANSAKTDNDSLVIVELELANSMQNRLGRVSGQDGQLLIGHQRFRSDQFTPESARRCFRTPRARLGRFHAEGLASANMIKGT